MTGNGGYWAEITRSRLSRRRALKGVAALGLGAAALSFAGCGGSDDGGAAVARLKDVTSLASAE